MSSTNGRGFAQRRSRQRREAQMRRSANCTACAFLLMRCCCMAGPTGPAGISSFHAVVTADFQCPTALVARGNWLHSGTIKQQHVGVTDSHCEPKIAYATNKSSRSGRRGVCEIQMITARVAICCNMYGGTCTQFLLAVTMLLRRLSDLEKKVPAASGMFQDIC